MILRPFEYVECKTVDDAVQAMVTYGDRGRLIAGGTALVPLMKHQIVRPEVLISLQGISALGEIRATPEGLAVGAVVSHRDIARSPLVRKSSPLLAFACGRVASPTIRSMGTIGGNLCYGESASDPSPALLALGARLRLQSHDGERLVSVQEFFLGFYETALRDGELLTEIEVPPMGCDVRWSYFKWTPRAREDKPLVGLAAVLALDGRGCSAARLAVGGVAACPTLLREASRTLERQELTDGVITRAAEAAAAEVQPVDDFQASGDYRREMLRVWVERKLRDLVMDRGES